MRQEFCLNHSSGLNAQNILSRILDQARLTGGLPKPVFLTFLSVAPVYHARVEARPKIMGILDGANIFQSTRPRARGLKWSNVRDGAAGGVVAPHAGAWIEIYSANGIYEVRMVAPHAWGATGSSWMLLAFWIFQSTRPHGGATRCNRRLLRLQPISIHAPAWGRDRFVRYFQSSVSHFNPRARMGARPFSSRLVSPMP